MIVRALVLTVLACLVTNVSPTPAHAKCGWVQVEQMLDGAVQIKTEWRCEGSVDPLESTAGGGDGPQPPRDSDLDAVCVRSALSVGEDPFLFCQPEPEADLPQPDITPDRVFSAFRRIPLPPAELQVQPPNGRTLVNFATNFYTEQGELTRTVTLLGRQVELRIWPEQFGWKFGDGATVATSSSGAPYPDLEVTHDYRRAGRVSPSVDTTYAAEFRVDGGPWRPVSGTVTIPGRPVELQVLTATPTLVGYR